MQGPLVSSAAAGGHRKPESPIPARAAPTPLSVSMLTSAALGGQIKLLLSMSQAKLVNRTSSSWLRMALPATAG